MLVELMYAEVLFNVDFYGLIMQNSMRVLYAPETMVGKSISLVF